MGSDKLGNGGTARSSLRRSVNSVQSKSRYQTAADSLTEVEVAELCEHKWAGHKVYDHTRRAWYVERGGIWQRDRIEETKDEAREICKSLGDKKFQTIKKVKAVEELTRNGKSIRVTSDVFDKHPMILGTPKGPVDLASGLLMKPDPSLFITMSTAVTPDADCPTPRWSEFLRQVTGSDAGLISLLKAMVGYSLTGETREQKLFFLYGSGRNGKGVLLRTVDGILGDYAHRAEPETFTRGLDRHPTDIAAMVGKRLVYCPETERGRKWAEGRIKDITGGDKLRARFIGKDGFEFTPQFKLIVSGNCEPQIESADPAMRHRFLVIPFDQSFTGSNADQKLEETLRPEWPGILAWAIEGCLEWQGNGLIVPDKVRDATEAYFERQDVFRQWIDESTVPANNAVASSAQLFQSWSIFARANGEDAGNNKTFAERMNRAGFGAPYSTKIDGRSVRAYKGLRVRA